ncbi:DUF4430 domain-containing protein [Methanolobus profundi]|nr:DUF4430 domain-containing protein [Methanolobus profundi]
MVLMLLLASASAASAHDVAVSRTISPTTVTAGESFDVSLEITVTGPITSEQNSSYATVKEYYTAVDDMENWIISDVSAQTPFDGAFKNGNNNDTGLFEFSTGGGALYYMTLASGGSGTFYINYTMTSSASAGAGVHSISGYYTDADFSSTGTAGYTVDVTGDSEVTLLAPVDPPTYIDDTMSLQDVINASESGDTIMMAAGTYVLPADLYINKSDLTFMANGGEVIITPDASLSDIDIHLGLELGSVGGSTDVGCDASGTTFNGITFDRINKLGEQYTYIDNIDVSDERLEDCTFINTSVNLAHNAVMKNCVLDSSSESVYIYGDNVLMEGNIGSCRQIKGGTYSLSSTTTTPCSDFTMKNNDLSFKYLNYRTGSCLIEDNNITTSSYISLYDNVSNIIRDNTFSSSYTYMKLEGQVYENDLIYTGTSTTAYVQFYENGTYYLNNIGHPTVKLELATYSTPEPVTYTYAGVGQTSYLGNYYSNYTGADTDHNGISDENVTDSTNGGVDEYPLMGAWSADANSIGTSTTVLYEDTVELGSDMTCTFVPYDNTGTEYDIAPLSAMAALMATGLDMKTSDCWYSSMDSFFVESIEGYDTPSDWSKYWEFRVNGAATSYGIGSSTFDNVSDGDVVSLVYVDAASGSDEYSVVITVDVTEKDDFLYYGAVDLVTDDTYTLTLQDDEYTVDSLSALGALFETGLEFKMNDDDYVNSSSFYLESIEDIKDPTETCYWAFYVNGAYTSYGIGHVTDDVVTDGDTVSFILTDWDSYDEYDEVHIHVNQVDTPVLVQRDIANQNFYEELLTQYGLTSTKVTVTLTAREDIDSLALEEVIPEGWTLTSSNDDEGVFKANLTDDTRYEWVWTDKMTEGDSRTIEYILTLPSDEDSGEYPVDGTASVFVGDDDINDIPVVGDDMVYVSATDWNPWNDIDSDGSKYITTDELQAAISCWLNDLPAPTTGDDITTNRLQLLVHYWVQNKECPEGADA